jgi:hypothetical protein
VRFIYTIANSVTLPGSFIRRSLRGRVQLPVPPLFSVSSRLWAATNIPLQLSPARSAHPPLRLTASARVIAILVRVLQLQYFSQPASNFILITTRTRSPMFARSSFLAWPTTTCTALFDGVSIRLLR